MNYGDDKLSAYNRRKQLYSNLREKRVGGVIGNVFQDKRISYEIKDDTEELLTGRVLLGRGTLTPNVRRLVLFSDKLLIRNVKDGKVKKTIPLNTVTSVNRTGDVYIKLKVMKSPMNSRKEITYTFEVPSMEAQEAWITTLNETLANYSDILDSRTRRSVSTPVFPNFSHEDADASLWNDEFTNIKVMESSSEKNNIWTPANHHSNNKKHSSKSTISSPMLGNVHIDKIDYDTHTKNSDLLSLSSYESNVSVLKEENKSLELTPVELMVCKTFQMLINNNKKRDAALRCAGLS